ncbi:MULTISPECIES: uridine kinase [Legionella]|uniref:Uridine kinase n=1 Tax=Legionella resiliens TaxID=2905958 RepID=A0ABS8WWU9_9GAMM|nr:MULTISPECIES: uridine kinase [unclassified Legionella]MCE0721794.1 uridine kinase [Legionella sp. 9fVS26]MCE3530948.1 uridine kinase [Legionella sp. 8cVS16]
MTILAVCGPIGSDYKAFSERCYSLLNKKYATLIDSSAYNSIDLLLSAIESAQGDIIIFGPDIFLNEKLRNKFNVRVFLELDSDLCLSNYIKIKSSALNDTFDLEEVLKNYESQIKPLNEKIRESSKFAALRRPQASANDVLIDLLINAEAQTLKTLAPSDSPSRERFFKPASLGQTSVTDKTPLVGTPNPLLI